MRRFFSQLPLYLIWLVAAVMFWGWIFTLLTDTKPAKKVSLFADVDAMEETLLSAKLEESLPEGLRMVRARPFSYVMFDESQLLDADLYLVPEDEIEEFFESFAPAGFVPEGAEVYEKDGQVYGIRVYDAGSGKGAALSYLTYQKEGDASQDYYLFFGVNSLHTGEPDSAACEIAEAFYALP